MVATTVVSLALLLVVLAARRDAGAVRVPVRIRRRLADRTGLGPDRGG